MSARIGIIVGVIAVALAAVAFLFFAPTMTASVGPSVSASPSTSDSASASASPVRVTGLAPVAFGGPEHRNGHPMVYLTYDDGPDPGSTDLVLNELKTLNVPATFFVLGMFMQTPQEQQLIKDEYAQGHSVSVHGFTHGDMLKWRRITVVKELNTMTSLIPQLTGATPTCFRPPYGSYGKAVLVEAKRKNLRIQLWSIDTEDWQLPGVDKMMQTISSQLVPGSVILMHDGRGHGRIASEVTRRTVALAKSRGYEFGQLCPMTKPGETASPVPTPTSTGVPSGLTRPGAVS